MTQSLWKIVGLLASVPMSSQCIEFIIEDTQASGKWYNLSKKAFNNLQLGYNSALTYDLQNIIEKYMNLLYHKQQHLEIYNI